MKRVLVIAIILTISGNTTFAVKSNQLSALQNKNTGSLPLKETALSHKQSVLPNRMILDVPLIKQMDEPMLYNGCEVTSLAMVLNYNGVNVTKNELAAKVKKVPLDYGNGLKGNPNAGFVGNMETGPGLSVFNGPIYDLAESYVGEKVVNLTNSTFTDLLRQVGQGHPVWIVTTTTFSPVDSFEEWNTPQGKIQITLKGHSVVITGYDDLYIYINDPYGFKNREVEKDSFIKAWEQMGEQAIVIMD